MKKIPLIITAPLLLFAVCFAFVGYQRETVSDDNQQEIAVIAEMNRCRTNPRDYAETTLRRHLERFVDGDTYKKSDGTIIMTNEGISRVLEAIEELKKMQPVDPLTFNEDLAKAARFHCEDTGPVGLIGHNSSDGTRMGDRVRRYMKERVALAENIDYGNSIAEDIVISLVIDDGIPSRGHLKNIMNSSYHRAGVAIGPHKQYSFMCTIDFSESK